MLNTTIAAIRVLLAAERVVVPVSIEKMVYIFMHVPGETAQPRVRDEDTKKDDSVYVISYMRMVFFFSFLRRYRITGSCILSAKYSWEFSNRYQRP